LGFWGFCSKIILKGGYGEVFKAYYCTDDKIEGETLAIKK